MGSVGGHSGIENVVIEIGGQFGGGVIDIILILYIKQGCYNWKIACASPEPVVVCVIF